MTARLGLAALSAAAALALLVPVRPRFPPGRAALAGPGDQRRLLAVAPLLAWLPSGWLVPAVIGAGALGCRLAPVAAPPRPARGLS